MSCIRVTKTNESESLLFNKLMEIHSDEVIAERTYKYIKSSLFKKKFGDFETDFGSEIFYDRVDENGEPLLQISDEGDQFFIDLDGNTIMYPFNKNGIKGILNYKEIESLGDALLFDYINQSGVNLDFNNIDLTEFKNLEDLNSFITKRLTKISTDLKSKNVQSKINARRIDSLLEYPTQLRKMVEDALLRKNIKVKTSMVEDDSSEVSDEDEATQSEEKPRELIRKNSLERDSKENLSSNIKLKLSLLKHPTDVDSLTGLPKLIPFNDVYATLLPVLTNTVALTDENGNREDLFELMKNKIRDLLIYKPHFEILLTEMDKMTIEDKREFVQAFNLHGANILTTSVKVMTKTDQTGIEYTDFSFTVKNIAKSGGKRDAVMATWESNFIDFFITNEGRIKESVNSIYGENIPVVDLLSYVTNDVLKLRTNLNDYNLNELESKTKLLLSVIGVNLTNNGFQRYLNNNTTSPLSEGEQRKIFQDLLFKVEVGLKKIQAQVNQDLEKGRIDYNTSYLKLGENVFNNLADSHALFVRDVSDASVQLKGKQIWLYNYPSYASSRVLEWKKDRNTLVKLYESSPIHNSSALIKWLLNEDYEVNEESFDDTTDTEEARIEESKRRIAAFDIGVYVNMSINIEGKNDVSDTSDIKFKDYYLDHVNKVLSNDFVRSTTLADKGTDLQLKTGFQLKSNLKETSEGITFEKNVVDTFLGYFNGERLRMIEAYKELNDPNIPNRIYYHLDANGNLGNAFKSQLFSDLSFSSKTENKLVNEIKRMIYDQNGVPLELNGDLMTDTVELEELKYKLRSYINQQLVEGYLRTKTNLIKNEIISENKDEMLTNNRIADKVFRKYWEESQAVNLTPLQTTQKAIHRMIADVYINGLSQNIEYSKMFTGDVAYYKSMIDYKKRVPASITDGLQLYLDPEDKDVMNVSIISSVNIASPFLDKIREMYETIEPGTGYKADEFYGKDEKNKGNINSADAQAWITPQRWEFLVRRLGKWTKTHDSLYKKMLSDKPENYSIEELKIAAQPLKGVYFYINNGVPIYLKYSQAVLSRNMINSQPLEKIFDKMTKDQSGKTLKYEDQIHELVTLDGIKVGAIMPNEIHDENGNLKEDFELNKMTITNVGWKLQQDLPVKTMKDTELGSQIQKNIYAGLIFNKDTKNFLYKGEYRTGSEIINEIVNTTGQLSDIGLEELFESLGVDTKTGRINNSKKLYATMIDDLKKTNGSPNVIRALEKGLPIPLIPQAVNKLKNLFTSKINKKVVKIKTNGGSFIQMSNFGISYEEGITQGVKFAPWADSTTNEPFIDRINEDGKIVIKPGGILLSGSFISKYIPDWSSKSQEELFGTLNEETGKYENGLIDEEILSNIIGYRIPNQGMSSNDALRVVGIIPSENGDTVVAYTGITAKTGSDFD